MSVSFCKYISIISVWWIINIVDLSRLLGADYMEKFQPGDWGIWKRGEWFEQVTRSVEISQVVTNMLHRTNIFRCFKYLLLLYRSSQGTFCIPHFVLLIQNIPSLFSIPQQPGWNLSPGWNFSMYSAPKQILWKYHGLQVIIEYK